MSEGMNKVRLLPMRDYFRYLSAQDRKKAESVSWADGRERLALGILPEQLVTVKWMDFWKRLPEVTK